MAQPKSRKRLEIGSHVGYYEKPDLLWLEFHGDVLAEHVEQYVAMRTELLAGQARILTLLDVRDVREPPPEARAAVARLKDPRPQASAVVGATFRTKVMAEFVVKAAYLFTGKRIELGFFDSTDAGYAWLVEMRHRIAPSAIRI